MKKKIALGLLLCAMVGSFLGGMTVTKTAAWYDPEPLGIVAIKK
ncbi:hypothetical protein [Tumebacillus permanentifrigoris]|nr:hypothetical protein [Tumebacillus permanentifrigoris]